VSGEGDSAPDPPRYRLRLFVAGTAARSLRTIDNLRRLCGRHLAGRVDLEVVDIYQQPGLAEQDQVVAAPTLVKLAPLPLRRIIGDLSDEPRVLRALELPLPAGADER
jgi:circadian clock protein KaiB